jgi:site-specific DNA recombinase
LQNRYYLGIVTYQGIEYEGKHPPLVTLPVFEAVQVVLEGHRQGGERAYRHSHYLKGTLRCERCRSRLAYCLSRGNGGSYAYYSASAGTNGGHSVTCLTSTLRLSNVPLNVGGEGERLGPAVVKLLRDALLEDVRNHDKRSDGERRTLANTTSARPTSGRYRWADKAMSGAVPDDIAKEKQAALAKQISHAEVRLVSLQVAAVDLQATVETCLELAKHCAVAYRMATPQGRRDWDQAWWNWLEVDVESEVNPEPKVHRYERTPMMEAVMTAEVEKALVKAQKRSPVSPPARVSRFVVVRESKLWCGREDSNLHPSQDQDLNLARLPVSPRPRVTRRLSLAGRNSGGPTWSAAWVLALA